MRERDITSEDQLFRNENSVDAGSALSGQVEQWNGGRIKRIATAVAVFASGCAPGVAGALQNNANEEIRQSPLRPDKHQIIHTGYRPQPEELPGGVIRQCGPNGELPDIISIPGGAVVFFNDGSYEVIQDSDSKTPPADTSFVKLEGNCAKVLAVNPELSSDSTAVSSSSKDK